MLHAYAYIAVMLRDGFEFISSETVILIDLDKAWQMAGR